MGLECSYRISISSFHNPSFKRRTFKPKAAIVYPLLQEMEKKVTFAFR